MRHRIWILAVHLAAALVSDSYAGKFNDVLSIGDAAPEWSELPDAVSGKKHSLADLKDATVIVVVFTCNSCPIATDYEERILKFAEKYGGIAKDEGGKTKDEAPRNNEVASTARRPSSGTAAAKAAVVAINVNKVKDDLPPAMKARAEKMKYPFPYLFDETQQIARDYGAVATPQFFVLDKERKLIYMGAMDDNGDAASVKQRYLEDAVEAALAGKKPEVIETAPSGCRIRYMRERRQPR